MNKAVFIDRDGVINKERGTYTYKIDDFIINDGIIESLQQLLKAGFKIIVITNQGGIAKGIYKKQDVEILHKHMISEFIKNDIIITDILYCTHHNEIENCLCRKPESLLFEKAIAKYNIDATKSFMIGDNDRDIIPAEKLGIK